MCIHPPQEYMCTLAFFGERIELMLQVKILPVSKSPILGDISEMLYICSIVCLIAELPFGRF